MSAKPQPKTAQMKSDVYKRHHGYMSDFDGANGECMNCGVPTYNAPDIHDAHAIQMQYVTEDGSGTLCEACFFDGYDRDGYHIAQPVTKTYYKVRVGQGMGRETYFFENWQAASGFSRRNDNAEYFGSQEVEIAKLEKVDRE